MSFNLKDYILVFEEVVPNDLCGAVLEEYVNTNEWIDATVKGGQSGIRTANTILMSTSDVISVNAQKRKFLDDEMFKCAGKAIKMYNEKYPFACIEEDSGYELLRYETGQFYKVHTDSFKAKPRAVSCSFILNDGYEGGEFAFFDKEVVIKAPKGAVVMFPSNFMYPHEILPVTNGTRYSAITWFV